MTQTTTCPRCGSTLREDVPGGCPRCLLAQAVEPGPTRSRRDGRTSFEAWPPEELQRYLPQFEILELLGQGGMGAVYRARQLDLDRVVALKVLSPDLAKDPTFTSRFHREARALARLSHPHVVSVHDHGETDGLHYLAMEHVDGATLRQLLDEGRLSPELALTLVPQLCDALQHAHESGVVHRDIKPENILLDAGGRVKVADFGLARLAEGGTDPALTQSGQVMGTLHYMAPEQLTAPGTVDHRADIYSLGVVFYEMLTGGLPLGRFAEPSSRPGVDGRLDGVVLRALENDPARRYQAAREVKSDVESLGLATDGPVIHPGPWARKLPAAWRRRLTWTAAAGLLTTCAGLIVVQVAGVLEFLSSADVRASDLADPAVTWRLLGPFWFVLFLASCGWWAVRASRHVLARLERPGNLPVPEARRATARAQEIVVGSRDSGVAAFVLPRWFVKAGTGFLLACAAGVVGVQAWSLLELVGADAPSTAVLDRSYGILTQVLSLGVFVLVVRWALARADEDARREAARSAGRGPSTAATAEGDPA